MDEYLSEQEQWEKFKAWLRADGPWMVVAILVTLGAIGGWNWWQTRQATQAQASHVRYGEIVASFSRGDIPGGIKLTDDLVASAPKSPYAGYAQLVTARIEVETGKSASAVQRLAGLARESKDEELALVARLRLARLQIDLGKPDDAIATLAAAQPGAFAPGYDEARGDALLAKGDRSGALAAYRSARGAGGDTVDGELLDLKINELDPS